MLWKQKMIDMRKVLIVTVILSVLGACSRDETDWVEEESTFEEVAHEMIVLGKKLKDPYSVENINRALHQIYPTRGERHDVTPTDLYVRFLPKNEEEYNRLVSSGMDLMDHPLDYQILQDGDYYVDPQVEPGQITWQYAVVKKDFRFPDGIHHEILDDCFIPEHDVVTRSDGLDWDQVVRTSYELTGNGELLEPETRASKAHPTGRITIEDAQFAGGKPIGVSGVKIVCNSFVKFSSCYTDRDGNYKIPRTYSSKVRYRLMFKNKMKFNIGMNLILVPASMSALGKGSPSGIDVHIRPDSNRKLFCRSVVNNAVYDYLLRCQQNDLAISAPPEGLRIWIMQKNENSSAVMMRHGTVLDYPLLKRYLGEYIGLIKIFLPDLTIGVKNKESFAEIYKSAIHECAHASHFQQVGVSYWNRFVTYVLKSFLHSGSSYGDGSGDEAGYCEIGEMWAYFLENLFSRDRYGEVKSDSGMCYWFHPQILSYLNERGFSVSEILKVLDEKVCSLADLKEALLNQFPDKEWIIRQAFDRYEN